MACKVHRRRSEVPIVRLRGPSLGETVMKFAFDCQQTIEIAHQCCWRATADEDGHLYEASPVKRFFCESIAFCFPRGLCLHSWHDGPLLGRAFAVKPQRPAGVAPLGARA